MGINIIWAFEHSMGINHETALLLYQFETMKETNSWK